VSWNPRQRTTWQPPRTLAFPDRETPYNVKVTFDARGDAWAVWLARSTSGVRDAIVVARSTAGVFGAAVQVTAPITGDDGFDLPAVTTHRGTALAAYAIYREGCMETEVARSADGLTWTRATAAACEPAAPGSATARSRRARSSMRRCCSTSSGARRASSATTSVSRSQTMR
jgi:hypothetical protein